MENQFDITQIIVIINSVAIALLATFFIIRSFRKRDTPCGGTPVIYQTKIIDTVDEGLFPEHRESLEWTEGCLMDFKTVSMFDPGGEGGSYVVAIIVRKDGNLITKDLNQVRLKTRSNEHLLDPTESPNIIEDYPY